MVVSEGHRTLDRGNRTGRRIRDGRIGVSPSRNASGYWINSGDCGKGYTRMATCHRISRDVAASTIVAGAMYRSGCSRDGTWLPIQTLRLVRVPPNSALYRAHTV
jgi:hypothetical protein